MTIPEVLLQDGPGGKPALVLLKVELPIGGGAIVRGEIVLTAAEATILVRGLREAARVVTEEEAAA